MKIFYTIEEWQRFRKTIPFNTIGFVPTMGNLHAGHDSLFKRSVQENDFTVASIFVNPTQFNQKEDFLQYPRTIENDLALLENADVDYCLLPPEDSMYRDGYRFQLQENSESLLMEGKHRPGHFNGVLTVVLKLFNLVRPTHAYFGEKDFQQLRLIQAMSEALFLGIEIIPCETIREPSGLAHSSRNNRLSPSQKIKAEQFAKIFLEGEDIVAIEEKLSQADIQVEYVEEHHQRRFAAVKIGDVRLIDNYRLLQDG